jgi:hypothetical protein
LNLSNTKLKLIPVVVVDVRSWRDVTQPFFWAKKVCFYIEHWPGVPDSHGIVFPLWLPTVLLAAFCWLVWQKTRAKPLGISG